MISIRVLLFAAHREAVGERSIDLQVPHGSTADGLYRCLVDRYPGLAQLRGFTQFAVNRKMVPDDSTLNDGDEVALIQPVSGGSR